MKTINYIFFASFIYKALPMDPCTIKPLTGDLQVTQDNLSKCPDVTRMIFFNVLMRNIQRNGINFEKLDACTSLKFILDSLSYYNDEPDKIETIIKQIYAYSPEIYKDNFQNLIDFTLSLARPASNFLKIKLGNKRLENRSNKYLPILDTIRELKLQLDKELEQGKKIIEIYEQEKKNWIWGKQSATTVIINQANEEEILKLLKEGANPNTSGESGKTILHFSVLRNHTKVLEKAISNYGNFYLEDTEGNTPLDTAIQNNNIEAINILLKHGLEPDIENIKKAIQEKLKKEVIIKLIEHGDVEFNAESINSILAYIGKKLFTIILEHTKILDENQIGKILAHTCSKKPKLAEIILTKYQNINLEKHCNHVNEHFNRNYGSYHYADTQDQWHKKYCTPLNWAITKQANDVAKQLITKGANTETALSIAINSGNIEIIDYLMNLNPNLNQKFTYNNGDSLLHTTITTQELTEDEKIEVLNKLINKGIDINVKNNHHTTAITLAAFLNLKKVVKFLYSKDAVVDKNYGSDPLTMSYNSDEQECQYKNNLLSKLYKKQQSQKLKDQIMQEIQHNYNLVKKRDIEKTESDKKRNKKLNA